MVSPGEPILVSQNVPAGPDFWRSWACILGADLEVGFGPGLVRIFVQFVIQVGNFGINESVRETNTGREM